jgi:hypothetical protein
MQLRGRRARSHPDGILLRVDAARKKEIFPKGRIVDADSLVLSPGENAVLRRTLFEALPVLSFSVFLTNCASPFKKRVIDIFSAPQYAGGQIVPFMDTGRQAINTPDIGRLVGDTKTATWQDISIVSSADNNTALTVLSLQTLVLFRSAVGGDDYRGYQGIP